MWCLVDEDSELYFSCCDSDANNVAGTAIQASSILRRMAKAGCRERAVILDCCFSGAIGAMFSKSDVGQQSQVTLNNIANASGTSILTSSTDVQTSPDGEVSPFTGAIVDSIQSGDADYNLDGKITMRDLFDYVVEHGPAKRLRKPMYFDIASTGPIYLSYSGKTKLAEAREALRRKLIKHLEEQRISDSAYFFAMNRFETDNGLGPDTLRAMDDLFDEFLKENIAIGTLVDRLMKIKFTHTQTPVRPTSPAPEPLPVSDLPLPPPNNRSLPPKSSQIESFARRLGVVSNLAMVYLASGLVALYGISFVILGVSAPFQSTSPEAWIVAVVVPIIGVLCLWGSTRIFRQAKKMRIKQKTTDVTPSV